MCEVAIYSTMYKKVNVWAIDKTNTLFEFVSFDNRVFSASSHTQN